jgi:hypothetical protein
VQTTVHAAIESLGQKLMSRDDMGYLTGEVLFNIEPRSYLVVGSLEQFQTRRGVNVPRFRSFELYRRHTWRPEIITFDELLQRARFIVEHTPDTALPEKDEDDGIPAVTSRPWASPVNISAISDQSGKENSGSPRYRLAWR